MLEVDMGDLVAQHELQFRICINIIQQTLVEIDVAAEMGEGIYFLIFQDGKRVLDAFPFGLGN